MPSLPTTLYVRLPGLFACALREMCFCDPFVPVAVASDKLVRDICPLAARAGVRVGEPVSRARRLCPALLVVPVQDIDKRVLPPATTRFFDVLADYTPVVEPEDNPDAAYADFSDSLIPQQAAIVQALRKCLQTGFAPVIGWGASRNAARACAECGLPPEKLSEADVRHLWPEDPAVAGRLFRLGLITYGAVAAIGESALVYQFGKMGRLLYQRSRGRDFMPVRAMYPPLRVEVRRTFVLEPITDEAHLRYVLGETAADMSVQLQQMGRHTRRLQLVVEMDDGRADCEWVLPAPAQQEQHLVLVLRRLRHQLTVASPITGITTTAYDLDLPPATTGSLFETRTVERRLALVATRQKLHSRYGTKALRRLGEIPVPRRETRRTLRSEKQQSL